MEKDYWEIRAIFEDEEEAKLVNFLVDESQRLNPEEEKKLDKIFDGVDGDPGAAYIDILGTCRDLSFATGYVFGQMFEISDKETKVLVDELKERLVKENLLRYQPKVKGPAKDEINNSDKGGELTPWSVLDKTEEIIQKAKGVIRTVATAVQSDQDGFASTLDIADDLLEDATEKIDLVMHMVVGKSPKKNEKGQG